MAILTHHISALKNPPAGVQRPKPSLRLQHLNLACLPIPSQARIYFSFRGAFNNLALKSYTEVTAPKSRMSANSIIPAYVSGNLKLPLLKKKTIGEQYQGNRFPAVQFHHTIKRDEIELNILFIIFSYFFMLLKLNINFIISNLIYWKKFTIVLGI